MRRDREIEFFDEFVSRHGEYDVLGNGAYERLTALFEEWISPRLGESCIDLGCGTGAFTAALRRFGLNLTGMDISAVSIAKAAQVSEGARFLVGDITATGFRDASHHIVVYSGVLHHFTTPRDRQRVLSEGFRILAPGGRLFSFDPSAHSPSMWLYRDPRSPFFSDKGKTENEILLRRDELSAELGAVGFGPLLIRGVGGITFRFVESRRARQLLKLYNAYEKFLRHSPFENRLGTFLVCAAKKPAR